MQQQAERITLALYFSSPFTADSTCAFCWLLNRCALSMTCLQAVLQAAVAECD